jgi:hypothetical protein
MITVLWYSGAIALTRRGSDDANGSRLEKLNASPEGTEMNRRLTITAAVATLLLPAASQAQDLMKSAAVPVSLPWKVNCHGLSTVPLTADAMQTLPLKLVTSLNCGEGLAALSDVEAYTVNVRTADGKTGYIASMYLMKAPPAKPAPRVAPASAATNNGVARWRPGAKGCDQFTKDGATVESLTANGVTVQVSLRDIGSKLRANVAVGNFGNLYVYVDPVGITLDSAGNHPRSLAYRDPRQLAGGMQPTAPKDNASTVNADYKELEFSPVFASANAVQKQPVEDLSRPQIKKAALPDEFSAEALKKGSLKPDGRTWGAVWFDRDANSSQYVMRVPIDNQIFEFPLSLDQPQSQQSESQQSPLQRSQSQQPQSQQSQSQRSQSMTLNQSLLPSRP